MKVCKDRSKRIGACADTGHWLRSGLNPLECLKKLEGRIISLHFKDLNEKGPSAHDVPWETGVCNVTASAPAGGCCGGPPKADVSACCAADETAKQAGAGGCATQVGGCGAKN